MSCFTRWILIAILSIHLLFRESLAERLGDMMYQNVIGSSACFRRLNGTHQMGCTSASSGSVGVIHIVENDADAWWIVDNGTAPPYMAVMSLNVFNKKIADHFIENPSAIAGVVLYHGPNKSGYKNPHWYSSDSVCPNEYSSAPGSTCSSVRSPGSGWNPHAMDLMNRDIPFPIFYVPAEKYKDADALIKCFKKFNSFDLDTQHERALCALELNSFMFAAASSEVCYRRTNLFTNINSIRFCDPLVDRNIYSSLFPRIENTTEKSTLLLTARLDSASLIEGLAPGAASTVAGLAIFLSTAKLLTDMLPLKDRDKFSKNVIFALFNGEAFDYIGSQNVAYEMLSETWPPQPAPPLTAEDVSLQVEIGQIGGSIAQQTQLGYPINVYVPETGAVDSDAPNRFIESFKGEASKMNVTVNTIISDNLPPSSLHTFRRVKKDGRGIAMPSLLLTDHGTDGFTNRYYHSVLDDAENLNFVYQNTTNWTTQKPVAADNFKDVVTAIQDGSFKWDSTQVKLANIATALARAAYNHITGNNYIGPIQSVSPQLIDEILFCFMVSVDCPLFAALIEPASSPLSTEADGTEQDTPVPNTPNILTKFVWPDIKDLRPPATLYVGVSIWHRVATTATGHVLAFLTGEKVPKLFNSTLCVANKNNTEDDYFNYHWMSGWSGKGECLRTTVNYTLAMSPAFYIDDYDFSSNEFSTWTESVWRSVYARMFVIPHGRGAKAAAGIGAVVTIVVLVLSLWVKKYAVPLFGEVKLEEDPAVQQPRSVQC